MYRGPHGIPMGFLNVPLSRSSDVRSCVSLPSRNIRAYDSASRTSSTTAPFPFCNFSFQNGKLILHRTRAIKRFDNFFFLRFSFENEIFETVYCASLSVFRKIDTKFRGMKKERILRDPKFWFIDEFLCC